MIIDHEMAFMVGLILGWRPPWQIGGLENLRAPGAHIFLNELRGRDIDFDPIKARWQGLSDARLAEYENAIPAAWVTEDQAVQPTVQRATDLIRNARNNLDGCIAEIRRVLE